MLNGVVLIGEDSWLHQKTVQSGGKMINCIQQKSKQMYPEKVQTNVYNKSPNKCIQQKFKQMINCIQQKSKQFVISNKQHQNSWWWCDWFRAWQQFFETLNKIVKSRKQTIAHSRSHHIFRSRTSWVKMANYARVKNLLCRAVIKIAHGLTSSSLDVNMTSHIHFPHIHHLSPYDMSCVQYISDASYFALHEF